MSSWHSCLVLEDQFPGHIKAAQEPSPHLIRLQLKSLLCLGHSTRHRECFLTGQDNVLNLGAKQCHFCIKLEPKLKDAQGSQDLSPESWDTPATPQQLPWVSILPQQHTLVRAARPLHSVWMSREMKVLKLQPSFSPTVLSSG